MCLGLFIMNSAGPHIVYHVREYIGTMRSNRRHPGQNQKAQNAIKKKKKKWYGVLAN